MIVVFNLIDLEIEMDVINYDDILDDYFFSKTLRPATEWS